MFWCQFKMFKFMALAMLKPYACSHEEMSQSLYTYILIDYTNSCWFPKLLGEFLLSNNFSQSQEGKDEMSSAPLYLYYNNLPNDYAATKVI